LIDDGRDGFGGTSSGHGPPPNLKKKKIIIINKKNLAEKKNNKIKLYLVPYERRTRVGLVLCPSLMVGNG
jgi:hypothetical protein